MRKLFYVRLSFRQQTEKLEFGGEKAFPSGEGIASLKDNLPEQSVILSERRRVEGSTHVCYGIRSNRCQDPSTTLGMTRFSLSTKEQCS